MKDQKNTASAVIDEEYKSAIQPVVDNTMRTDILGPHFCRVLKDHTPASECLIELITKATGSDSKLKKAIKEVINEHNNETKMRWIDRTIGVAGTIVLAIVIWGIQQLIAK